MIFVPVRADPIGAELFVALSGDDRNSVSKVQTSTSELTESKAWTASAVHVPEGRGDGANATTERYVHLEYCQKMRG